MAEQPSLIDQLLVDMTDAEQRDLHEEVHEGAVRFARKFARDKQYKDLAPSDIMSSFCVTNKMVETYAKQDGDIMTGDTLHELLMVAFMAGVVWRDSQS